MSILFRPPARGADEEIHPTQFPRRRLRLSMHRQRGVSTYRCLFWPYSSARYTRALDLRASDLCHFSSSRKLDHQELEESSPAAAPLSGPSKPRIAAASLARIESGQLVASYPTSSATPTCVTELARMPTTMTRRPTLRIHTSRRGQSSKVTHDSVEYAPSVAYGGGCCAAYQRSSSAIWGSGKAAAGLDPLAVDTRTFYYPPLTSATRSAPPCPAADAFLRPTRMSSRRVTSRNPFVWTAFHYLWLATSDTRPPYSLPMSALLGDLRPRICLVVGRSCVGGATAFCARGNRRGHLACPADPARIPVDAPWSFTLPRAGGSALLAPPALHGYCFAGAHPPASSSLTCLCTPLSALRSRSEFSSPGTRHCPAIQQWSSFALSGQGCWPRRCKLVVLPTW
uniref:Uncharacterized protein n=1 Tax=Mycena chlorophos TaxID=658473 RepID=A0ABQ0KVN8_MYCCL|nr:predicted protein [Mycena chlorophos]